MKLFIILVVAAILYVILMNVIVALCVPKNTPADVPGEKAQVVGKSIHTAVRKGKDGEDDEVDEEYSVLIKNSQNEVRSYITSYDMYEELSYGDLGKYKSIGNKLRGFKKFTS